MPSLDIPFFGTLVLCLILVSAAYAIGVSVLAGTGRPRLIPSARLATFATCALVLLAVLLLAYAFQTHDFRIRYVARYSDRSMPWWYLVTSLWGGQDGSLLWWTLLVSAYTGAVNWWLRNKYQELAPWVLATLMGIVSVFVVLMLFAANPFSTTIAAAPPVDGEGLNPLLQNYWMTIHPPSLYLGFTGWSVPFAFVIAALITGRVGEEWIIAVRRWALIAWVFLSVGNLLGALWSYEELGWGGYWAWDPVENASFMPWLIATAFIHSIMVQERYGMLKVWNVFLLCMTYFMTIFGTFLTRSGLIASVHSFARSDIGIWFVAYMVVIVVGCTALVIWRLDRFKEEHKIHSVISREFAFLLNNWALLAMMLFVAVATTWPLISDWLRGEEVTVGPPFYNKWMIPFGLALVFLMGVGPLISWRKATGKNLVQAFTIPVACAGVVFLLHLFLGWYVDFPPYVEPESIYDTSVGRVLGYIYGVAPVVSSTICAFVLATIVQEFVRGAGVRRRNAKESPPLAVFNLVARARRRYGGYIVHAGIVCMFIGFTGSAYDVEKEAALRIGTTMDIDDYRVLYRGVREEIDPNKRAIYTDVDLYFRDEPTVRIARLAPAKFVYRTHPDMPTTEVDIHRRVREDVYVIMSSVNPETSVATFRVKVLPLVSWIWFGGLILLLGTGIALMPTVREVLGEASEPARARAGTAAAGATATLLALLLALGLLAPSDAAAQGDSSSLHAGTVIIDDPDERQLFNRLLCQCGDCARLPMDTCACSWAEERRADLRDRLGRGETVRQLMTAWREEFGRDALSIPDDSGFDRALWALPIGIALVAIGGVVWLGIRWAKKGRRDEDGGGPAAPPGGAPRPAADGSRDYDRALEDELSRLEE